MATVIQQDHLQKAKFDCPVTVIHAFFFLERNLMAGNPNLSNYETHDIKVWKEQRIIMILVLGVVAVPQDTRRWQQKLTKCMDMEGDLFQYKNVPFLKHNQCDSLIPVYGFQILRLYPKWQNIMLLQCYNQPAP